MISADEGESSESGSDDEEEEEEDDDAADDDEDEEETDDEVDESRYRGHKKIFYKLFDAIRTCKIDNRSVADPFVRLPNRRCALL